MDSTIYKDTSTIIYSQEFRNLQNKTQLFCQSIGSKVRTRLTHSIEVKNISHFIANGINKKINDSNKNNGKNLELLDLELIDAIALAHDIGHTPFGHVGERTINNILMREDGLGGLLNTNSNKKYKVTFKHNVNSAIIVKSLHDSINWKIIDGVLCHTKIYSKDWPLKIMENEEDTYFYLNKIFKTKFKNKRELKDELKKSETISFCLEGQVVAIADEIAQRISDIADGIKPSFYGKIKKILNVEDESKNEKEFIENYIREKFTESVINNFQIDKVLQSRKYDSELKSDIYEVKLISLEDNFKDINKNLEEYIKLNITYSQKIRRSDGRSKYIIRQIFKAFIKDVKLIPDEVHVNYFKEITQKNQVLYLFNLRDNVSDEKEKAFFNGVIGGDWEIKQYKIKNKRILNFDVIVNFLKKLQENDKQNCKFNDLDRLYNLFLLHIARYLALLTDNEAYYQYNILYGHLPSYITLEDEFI